MEDTLGIAESIINKYDFQSSFDDSSVTSIFSENRDEAIEYLKSVTDLQTAMRLFVTENPGFGKLARAQTLMGIAMKRLEKEFYLILSSNREHIHPESCSISEKFNLLSVEDDGEDELKIAGESISEVEQASNMTMADLQAIADCMISSGYGKECVKIYQLIRKSIIDEGLYRLGVERLSFWQVQKMDWEVLEVKIKHWLYAMKIAVKTLFYNERILCNHVFHASNSMIESCFTEISKEGAMTLFGFPENVARCKKSPEKMFRLLDLYESIASLLPEIDSIFSFDSISVIRSLAVTSVEKLGDAVRITLTEFESAIQKESSRSPVPGGGIHPLTRYVMNYMSFLAEYNGVLVGIFVDVPEISQFPEAYSECSEIGGDFPAPITVRLVWLVLVLLCKIDGKADLYKDVALSYLFLANNLQYVVVKVRTSNLNLLLGDLWMTKHESKIKQYASNYERMGWEKVFSTLPANIPATMSSVIAREIFRKFSIAFVETYRKQSTWVIPDSKLRDEIKVSISKKIVPLYHEFYEKFKTILQSEIGSDLVVRLLPDNLDNYLSDLFYGNGVSGSSSLSPSSSSSTH